MARPSAARIGRALWRWVRGPLSPLPLGVVLLGVGVFAWLAGDGAPPSPIQPSLRENQYDSLLRSAATRHMPPGWDWLVLKAMVRQESNFRADARSRVGAQGLCQMMPKTAASMGVSPEQLSDPRVSIEAGTKYLRQLWDRWQGLPDRAPRWTRSRFAIASYNAGITRLRRTASKFGADTWDKLRPHVPTETQIHIHKVFDVFYHGYSTGAPARERPQRPSFSSNRR